MPFVLQPKDQDERDSMSCHCIAHYPTIHGLLSRAPVSQRARGSCNIQASASLAPAAHAHLRGQVDKKGKPR